LSELQDDRAGYLEISPDAPATHDDVSTVRLDQSQARGGGVMIATVTPEGLDYPEQIAPPMEVAITIPVAIDLRHPAHDGYVIYVGRGAFMNPSRDSVRVTRALAKAVFEHLKTLPPFEVE
jgi:hypothetical protein